MSARAAVRPAFGPSLPALLRRRFGVPPAVTLGVVAVPALAGAVAIVLALARPPYPGTQVVHEGPPVFNMLYTPGALHEARPHAGELLRLEGRREKLSVSVVVRELRLPRYDGDITHGQLPVYADHFADAQAAQLPGYRLASEGRARVNNGVGYEMTFQAVRPQRRDFGRDVLLAPDDLEEGRGLVTVSLRQGKPGGKLTKGERNLAYLARKAYRSFRFGTVRG